MNPADLLAIIQVVNSVVDLTNSVHINVNRFVEMKEKAKREGRDISDEELKQLHDEIKAAIAQSRKA